VREPVATNLVSFVKRDSTHWRSASWRDSDAGYANGRFAMDINAIWAPRALESMATILSSLQTLGIGGATLDSVAPSLAAYARDGASLRRAIQTWKTARRHFAVTLDPRTARERIDAKLGSLPANERRHWDAVLAASGEVRDSVHFLALSLDSAGRPIPVVNTDPSTELFLEEFTGGNRGGFLAPELVLHDVEPFVRPYPVGLFVEGLGPLVANDAYASPRIWSVFERDQYHSPRVVWGREVNLFFLGVANQLAGIEGDQSRSPEAERFARTLEDALRRTLDAVHASGLEHNELWSYRFVGDSLVPTRYGTSSDVQLWNGTDLAVQFVLARRARK
jgi:hypothetical protein